MEEKRPDPDALLRQVQKEESLKKRGKLKIFFGATAGVGKTYAMLQAAHEQQSEKVDVIVGWVETHKRAETEALLQGMAVLPPRAFEYKGVILKEFDLDGALARRPNLILIDELAHTNAPGSRHEKRWQDVRELLGSGINVYTTLNVQHLESLNDVVGQITGVQVHETVADSIFELADDVEVVDLPPDDLLKRLKEGKVYLPEQAEQAIKHFFTKGNLIALRELALRQIADRVDEQMEVYRHDHAVEQPWPVSERIMVCVNLKPRGPRLVRAGRRMAAGLHSKWLAVYVQTSRHLRLPETERQKVIQTLRLAEELGAETVTLSGDNVSEEILSYARKRNITKIIVGKPLRSRWREYVFGSVVGDLVRNSGEIDVYVITGEAGKSRPMAKGAFRRTSNAQAYGKGLIVVSACSVLAWFMFPHFTLANLIMVYLVGVVIVATRYGRGPSILASFVSVAVFDFLFVPPYFSFAVSDMQYLITFGVMLVISLLISGLTGQIRHQAEVARQRAWRTEVLYAMSRELATSRRVKIISAVAARHIREVFDSQVGVLLPDASGHLILQPGEHGKEQFKYDQRDEGVARWAFEHNQMAGLGTETLPGSEALYLPLVGLRGTVGVLGVRPIEANRLMAPEQLHLLETFAGQIAPVIERARLAKEAQSAKIKAETERTRKAVLKSISNDLQTPLEAITGSASSFLEGKETLSSASRHHLIEAIYEEATRLDQRVKNLFDVAQLETRSVPLQKESHSIVKVVKAVLTRLENPLKSHILKESFPPDLPDVLVDDVLIEQVLTNLLGNALTNSPPESQIDLSASVADKMLLVEIADRGQGFPPGDEERIFDELFRIGSKKERRIGLGLPICRSIIEAHGGRLWAENRQNGGALFRFTLPIGKEN